MATLPHPAVTPLAGLVARACAARTLFNDCARREDMDEDEFRELEQADFDASRAVRAKLAELGVDPIALGSVLS